MCVCVWCVCGAQHFIKVIKFFIHDGTKNIKKR